MKILLLMFFTSIAGCANTAQTKWAAYGDCPAYTAQQEKYDTVKGKPVNGLYNRRAGESAWSCG